MLKDFAGIIMVLMVFCVPAAVVVSGIAVICERLLLRWTRRFLRGNNARFVVFWAVIALIRLSCLWLTRPPDDSMSYFLLGAVYIPEMLLIDLPKSPMLEITLRAVLIIGDSAFWAVLLCKLWKPKKPSDTTVA